MKDIALLKGDNELNVALTPLPKFAELYVPPTMDVVVTNGDYLNMYWRCAYSVTITNNGDAPGTYTIRWQHSYDGTNFGSERSREITLNPGESYGWSDWKYVRLDRTAYGMCKLWGDWAGNNHSEGIATRDMTVPEPPPPTNKTRR